MATQLHAQLQVFVFLGRNWELSYIHEVYQLKKCGETCTSYLCIVCLEFYTTAPRAGKLPWLFPTMCPITAQHLSQLLGSDARKQGTRNDLRKKSVLASFPCVCAITEPHHCQGCWRASSLFKLIQQHLSWQAIAFLSPFRNFKPLTPFPQEATVSCLLSKVLSCGRGWVMDYRKSCYFVPGGEKCFCPHPQLSIPLCICRFVLALGMRVPAVLVDLL